MPRTALDELLLGGHGIIEAGQEIPESWNVGGGEEQPTDFERLEALGVVAPVKKGKAKAADPAPEPEPVDDPADGE